MKKENIGSFLTGVLVMAVLFAAWFPTDTYPYKLFGSESKVYPYEKGKHYLVQWQLKDSTGRIISYYDADDSLIIPVGYTLEPATIASMGDSVIEVYSFTWSSPIWGAPGNLGKLEDVIYKVPDSNVFAPVVMDNGIRKPVPVIKPHYLNYKN
jgi:hypothetical protein